ncbi:MAG: arginine--tRNA ligase [Candidatus Nomurabacteria bacterium]|nr:MAG: arginine--tRNA ligase [Candidatus Nomurabacteria bacterium]
MDTKIARLIQEEFGVETSVQLSRPEPQFGDYATNVALQLAGKLSKPPREIAERIAEKLRASGEFTEVNVAGPGFINIRLSGEALLDLTRDEPIANRAGQNIVIETNNPNPFKAMHIGHAFNAILADTIANLLAVDGAQVHRVSYHGDVGLHVGKSMYSLLRYVDGDSSKLSQIPEKDRNTFMSRMYAEGSKAYKEDESAKTEINKLAQESFAPTSDLYSQVYDTCKAWSFEQIDTIVAQLGNVPIERRFLESEADPVGVETVKRHVPDVFQESDGALIFKGSEYGSFDNAFVAGNGSGLYGARDLGLMQLKNNAYHAEKSYIVTGGEQRDYFKGVIAAAELCIPELKDVTTNIATGLVKLATGKMSSRDGDVIEIGWLFNQFREAIRERGGEPTDEIIAGALRYQFLKVKIGGDVVFDVSEAVSLTGNTGSYLQYAYARAKSILGKIEGNITNPKEVNEEDRPLIRKLSEYHEVIQVATRSLEPHHICTYLFELAQEFNRYYEKNQVVGDEHELHRAGLVALYADTLKAGLMILGIAAPAKM